MKFEKPIEPCIPEITYFAGVARTEINLRLPTDVEIGLATKLNEVRETLHLDYPHLCGEIETLLTQIGFLKP